MLIHFQIEYKTYFGQQLMLSGSLPQLGGGERSKAIPMKYNDGSVGMWAVRVELETPRDFTYRYFIRNYHQEAELEEWGDDRVFLTGNYKHDKILLLDHWRAASDPEFALFSSAFTRSILKPIRVPVSPSASKSSTGKTVMVRFSPLVARVNPGHRVAIAGSSASLGAWDEARALPLDNLHHPVWTVDVCIPVSDFPVRYKFLIQDEMGKTLFWEKSDDRVIHIPAEETPGIIEARDQRFDFPKKPWKGAGVAIPVFSLRRENGFGVGEFTDLKLLVDWASQTGIRMIQILPVNDTVARHTWKDSYPYAAISVFALHPIYINLQAIGQLNSRITGQVIEEQGKFLNSLAKIDYEAVMVLKSRFFKLIYDQQKETFLREPDFLMFYNDNAHWLRPYAAFSYLRDLFNTPDFTRWNGFTRPTGEILDDLTDPAAPHYDDIAIHYFIQYHAHRQLLDAAAYARSKGVVLKGDIPIGIYRNSVDAWLNPGLYNMNAQAGAPPDDFSVIGQNWRFPTYNWEAMAANNFSWWQQRLRQMSVYFDAFRIDHILGFFRIWEIPANQVQGLMGYFNPSLPYTKDEILAKGIFFDEARFCKPYIRERNLRELFGGLTEFVKNTYLESCGQGCYNLLPEFDTQQKVKEQLTPEEDAGTEERSRLGRIMNGLFSLISEVIFLEAPGSDGQAWFPRNSFHNTHSYNELDGHTRQQLNELYIEYFYRRNEEFWKEKALHKLPAIKTATNMLLCGEDLGMVPASVPHVMNELGILSLEVQRMPKNPRLEFGQPDTYPYLSVATPSSHDTSTIRGWWEEDHALTAKFYNQMLGLPGSPPQICLPELVSLIINQHLKSPSMWAVFPIQDLLGTDEQLRLTDPHAERINQPGNPEHYWRYRLHLSLEDLLKQSEFNRKIRKMIDDSGRSEVY